MKKIIGTDTKGLSIILCSCFTATKTLTYKTLQNVDSWYCRPPTTHTSCHLDHLSQSLTQSALPAVLAWHGRKATTCLYQAPESIENQSVLAGGIGNRKIRSACSQICVIQCQWCLSPLGTRKRDIGRTCGTQWQMNS